MGAKAVLVLSAERTTAGLGEFALTSCRTDNAGADYPDERRGYQRPRDYPAAQNQNVEGGQMARAIVEARNPAITTKSRSGSTASPAIRRGTFRSVKGLVEKIGAFLQRSSANTAHFVRSATVDHIFASLQRLCEGISGIEH